jgi:large subunit ribosomal protein L24
MNVHKDDTVLVIAGKDKGKRGRVREVHPADNKVIVEGINVMRKHTRGRAGARQAGIVEVEAPMDASKVMVVCAKCNKPVRVAHTFLADGSKARSCRNCNELLDRDPDKRWSR